METKLFWGKWLINGSDTNLRVIKNGAVLVEDGRILAVGEHEHIARDYSYDFELGSENFAVIPGLINAHAHGRGIGAFQGGVLDAPLELWLPDLFNSYRTDPYWDTLLSAMNMISLGTTTVLCHWCERDPSEGTYRDDLEKSIIAFLESGMRVAFAPAISDQGKYAYTNEDKLLSKLPSKIRKHLDYCPDDPQRIKTYFDSFDYVTKKYHDQSEKIQFQYGPNGVQWCSDALLEQIQTRMVQDNTRVHFHLLETKYQKIYGHSILGKSLVRHLNEIGILNERVSLAHCVWLDVDDINLLSKTKALCIHNPSSNIRLYSGNSPVLSMIRRGVRIALGTDSTGLNDDDDLIQEMRLCWLLQRQPGIDAKSLSSTEVFSMATSNAANAAGFADIAGGIEVGKKADLVLLDIRRVTSPILSSRVPVLDALLQRISKSDIAKVIIDGNVVFDRSGFKQLNIEEVIKKLVGSYTESDKEIIESIDQLKKMIRQFYTRNDM